MHQLKVLPIAFFFCCLLIWSGLAIAAVQGKTVDYHADDTVLKGYIVYDDTVKGKRPGILVVHEWWGHNDYVRGRADMLAKLGYIALAVDMYGDGKTATHPADAKSFSAAAKKNMATAQARFAAAMDLLKADPHTDGKQIAAIGYCFGGGMVLEMARSGMDLSGVVSFHGGLTTNTPAEAGKVKARVLVLNGADDPMVKPEHISAFKEEMEKAGVSYRLVNYPDAKHAFTNPEADRFGKEFSLPLAYDPEADAQSWQAMQDFFKEIFP